MNVVDPAGAKWRVRRIWTPWRVRHRWPWGVDGLELLVTALATLWLPLELLIAILAGLVLRAFGRPWRVVAVCKKGEDPQQLTWKVRGWQQSRDAIGEIAERIRLGEGDWARGAECRRLRGR